MTVYVADIASYQRGLVPAELKPFCAGLMVKCTQGSGYDDPDYPGWIEQARTSGLLRAAYHFIDGSAPAAQAANLAAHIGDKSLPVMLDEEEVGLAQALEVADAISAEGMNPRMIYLSRSYWDKLGRPDLAAPLGSRKLALINAAYPSEATGSPAVLYLGDSRPEWDAYGGTDVALWQFTDNAALAGQRIDVSAYRGSITQLAKLIDTTAPATGTGSGSGSGSGSSPGVNWPTQHPGAASLWVTLMQRALMLAGFDPKGVDGRYGTNTGAALKAAQHAFGITVDGVCGPITWSHLRARTLTVQRALVGEGLGAGGTDSVAGPLTASELLGFQRSHHLLQDGICGQHTSRALGIPAL